uniref:Uncharacterized protein n=1 Tax=viral metagenome TaxID=1070528 RepID=A0A6H1ZQV3_9ZZZZ
MAVNAYQQHTCYFTEKVKGNVPKFGQNGYVYGNTETTSAVMENTANALVSYPIGYTSSTELNPRNDAISNKKIIVGMNVTVAYADVVAILSVSASPDGTNWTDVATAIADTTPNVTGIKQAVVDLTDIYAPYFRLTFNSSGLNVGTSGKSKFFYALPQ